MKIAVLGAGAMGCLYGGSLALAGNDVTFLDVAPAVIQAIHERGVLLTRDDGCHQIPARASRAEECKEIFELLVVFTKTIYSENALQSARHLLKPGLTVLTIQNGLGNDKIIEKFVDREQIIVGMTGYPAENKGPGESESHGSSFTGIIDATGQITERTRRIGEKITEAGLNCIVSEEVFAHIWEKASFNAAVNGLSTVTQLTMGHLGESSGRELAYEAAREGILVARARGIPASWEKVKDMLDHAFVDHYSHKVSMLQDYLLERTTETDFIQGAIAAYGEEAGVETPVNGILNRLIRVLQETYAYRER